jgi:type VI secretion system protein ImpK
MTRALDNPVIIGLPDLCADAFALVLQLRNEPPRGSFAEFRSSVNDLVRQMQRKATDHAVAKSDLDDATFAVVATIDELVQTSNWQHHEAWLNDSLAVQHFDEPNAGEVFYDRLQAISRSNTARRRELLEVYASCIHLGFRGTHGGADRDELRSILTDTVRQLTDGGSVGPLAKATRPVETMQQRIRRASVWGWVALGLVVCAGVNLLLRHLADRSYRATVTTIQSYTSDKTNGN